MIGTGSSATAGESSWCQVPARRDVITWRQSDSFPLLSTRSFRSLGESVDGETQLVAIYGDVDLRTARPFRSALDGAAQDGKARLIVDMTGVTFIDSSGLAVLIGAQKAFRPRTRVIIVCPEDLRRIFEVTRVDCIVSVVGSIAEALVA